MYDAEWACPLTALASADNIVMNFYAQNSLENWIALSTRKFGTEQLGASQLDASTWHVYAAIEPSQGTVTSFRAQIAFDDTDADTRIENFSYSEAPSEAVDAHQIM